MADMEILHGNTVNIPMQERTVTIGQRGHTNTNESDEDPDGQNIGPMYKNKLKNMRKSNSKKKIIAPNAAQYNFPQRHSP